MIELGVCVMLAAMGIADMIREVRLLTREQRLAALDEDDRRRAGKVKRAIGYRA